MVLATIVCLKAKIWLNPLALLRRKKKTPFRTVLERCKRFLNNGKKWKIINEKDWYGDWKVDFLTGRISMQVTPTKVGMLKLSVRLKEGNSYSTMISYQVVDR